MPVARFSYSEDEADAILDRYGDVTRGPLGNDTSAIKNHSQCRR
jgi:hypothetical protein